ncbi:MAG TPA: hypothetical protein VMV65_00200 [Alphaproteobacteria bacterium]|nr:hypothetical protein [Alphaproteobacteria bacterium]
MRSTIVGTAFALASLAIASGCGGSGTATPSTTATASPTPTPSYEPTGAPATLAPISTATASSADVASGGFGVTIAFPAASSGSGNLAISGSTAPPSGVPGFTASGTALYYVEFQPSATLKFPSYPQFQFTLAPADTAVGYNFFGAIYTNDAAFPSGHNAWSAAFLGAATDSGQTLYYPNPSTPLTFTANDVYVFALYETPT